MSTNQEVYEGACLCGSIRLKVAGRPVAAGICHCESCRTWHAAPINAYSVWRDKAIEITQGEELLANYQTEKANRHWCSKCGSGLLNRLGNGATVVYAVVLMGSGYVPQPGLHIHCDESVLDLQDGLPKYLDMPAKYGGSGETVDEPVRTGLRSLLS